MRLEPVVNFIDNKVIQDKDEIEVSSTSMVNGGQRHA
jgi:hypothetical protein